MLSLNNCQRYPCISTIPFADRRWGVDLNGLIGGASQQYSRITHATGHRAYMEMEASCLIPTKHSMLTTTELRLFKDLTTASSKHTKSWVFSHVYGKLNSDRERHCNSEQLACDGYYWINKTTSNHTATIVWIGWPTPPPCFAWVRALLSFRSQLWTTVEGPNYMN
jgi:hypothetical protein